jgi:hypothetical protein
LLFNLLFNKGGGRVKTRVRDLSVVRMAIEVRPNHTRAVFDLD